MFSQQEKLDFIEGQISAKRGWIASHGAGSKNPWPETDCDIKKRALEILKEIRDDYAAAVQRRQA